MSEPQKSPIAGHIDEAAATLRQIWQVLKDRGPGKVQFWFIALLIGIAAGFAALSFRKAIETLQAWLYGTDDVNTLHSFAATLEWYWVIAIPVAGGAPLVRWIAELSRQTTAYSSSPKSHSKPRTSR